MKTVPASIRLAKKADAKLFVDRWNENFRRGHLQYSGTQLRGKGDVKFFRDHYTIRRHNEFSFMAVADKNTLVGNCSFWARERGRTRHRGEVGWFVDHAHVGKGIATQLVAAVLTEATRRGFKRVEAEVVVENKASIRLARKMGFRLEGRRKAGILLDSGRYADTYLYGKILK